MNIDDNILDYFNSYIVKVVREEMYKLFRNENIEKYKNVKVTSVDVDNNTVTAEDLSTGETFVGIPNRSGEKFDENSVGNVVRLYETNNEYQKYYIGLNFGKET